MRREDSKYVFFFFQEIDDFVEKMFQYLNIEYKKELQVKDKKIDFVLKSSNDLDTLVEIKEVKNNSINTVISAVNQLKYYREIYPKEKLNKYSFVIIFGSIDKQQKDYFKKDNIIIIDIANIIYLIKDNQDLMEQLKNLLTFSIIDFVPQKIDLEKYMNYVEKPKTAKEKFRNVVELTMEMDKVIMDLPVKPENAKKVLDVLYDEPIVSRKKILELIDIKPTTLNVCINALKEKNIIIETTGYSRNQVFAFQKYIDLFLK